MLSLQLFAKFFGVNLVNFIDRIYRNYQLYELLLKAQHLPKVLFCLLSPIVFIGVGVLGIVSAVGLKIFQFPGEVVSITLFVGAISSILGIVCDLFFAVAFKKQLDKYLIKSPSKPWNDLKIILNPVIEQLREEKKLMLSSSNKG